MRHRIGPYTGLGNPEKAKLDNKGIVPKDFADEAIELYFKEWEGCDFSVNKKCVTLGIEPTYQFDRLKTVSIHFNKEDSYIENGKAWGGYGSQVTSTRKFYGAYKNQCKFVRFVDKWHPILFRESK